MDNWMEGQEEEQNDAIILPALSSAGRECIFANQKYRYPWLIFLTM